MILKSQKKFWPILKSLFGNFVKSFEKLVLTVVLNEKGKRKKKEKSHCTSEHFEKLEA